MHINQINLITDLLKIAIIAVNYFFKVFFYYYCCICCDGMMYFQNPNESNFISKIHKNRQSTLRVTKVASIQTIICHGCKIKRFNFFLGSVHFLMRTIFIHPLQRCMGGSGAGEKEEHLNKLRLCLLAAFTPHNRALSARF